MFSRSGLVRMLCALSLLLVAFAHRPLSFTDIASSYSDVDVAEYILPDGSLPVICVTDEEDDHHQSAATHCEACRIVASVDLPSPLDSYLVTRWFVAADLVILRDASPERPALRPGASPRGPPSFTV